MVNAYLFDAALACREIWDQSQWLEIVELPKAPWLMTSAERHTHNIKGIPTDEDVVALRQLASVMENMTKSDVADASRNPTDHFDSRQCAIRQKWEICWKALARRVSTKVDKWFERQRRDYGSLYVELKGRLDMTSKVAWASLHCSFASWLVGTEAFVDSMMSIINPTYSTFLDMTLYYAWERQGKRVKRQRKNFDKKRAEINQLWKGTLF